MTEAQAKKFREYARRIEHEAWKHDLRGKRRMNRFDDVQGEPPHTVREARSARAKEWLRLESASCERFVRKIVKLVEDFEIE